MDNKTNILECLAVNEHSKFPWKKLKTFEDVPSWLKCVLQDLNTGMAQVSKPNCFHGEQTMWCTLTMKPLDFSGTSTKWWRSQILHPASVDLVVTHILHHTPAGTHTLPSLTLPWAVRELFTEEYPAEQKSARHHSQRHCCTLDFRIIHYLSEMPL